MCRLASLNLDSRPRRDWFSRDSSSSRFILQPQFGLREARYSGHNAPACWGLDVTITGLIVPTLHQSHINRPENLRYINGQITLIFVCGPL